MDVRHQSYKEQMLNQLIITINTFIKSNTENLLNNPLLQQQLIFICKNIYSYLGVKVDVEDILTKHNLLSIDVVLFPEVHDPEAGKVLKDTDFVDLISELNDIIKKYQHSSQEDIKLLNELSELITPQ